MNESDFSARLRRDLAAATGGLVIKHCDRFTRGVPDLSVTVRGVTTWIEDKVLPREVEPVQRWFLRRLERSLLVVWDDDRRVADVDLRGERTILSEVGYERLLMELVRFCTEKNFDRS